MAGDRGLGIENRDGQGRRAAWEARHSYGGAIPGGRSFARHCASLRMTTGRGARGQVLIIAVLVLFAVASLAALLAAIVGAQIVQVTRYTDVTELRSAAESILSLANEQLTYGWKGADWRPPREPYRVGKAIVGLSVDYGPVPPPVGDVQTRYMRISVAARFPDDPFLRYSMLGLKPLLLTDYARFITDRYELRQPAALGADGVQLGVFPRPDSIDAGAYEFTINGPIRCNTDLEWHGRSQVNLFTPSFVAWNSLELFRDDRIEVAGAMRPAVRPEQPDLITDDDPAIDANRLALTVDGVERTNNVFNPDTQVEQTLYTSGFADEALAGLPVTNTWRVLADLPRYQAMFPADPSHPELAALLSVPRVQPPRFDAIHPEMQTNRYLILTRDAGEWVKVGASLMNTGLHGWGWTNHGGIYLDNFEDIQYAHDLDKLRRNWMGGYRQEGDAADGRRDRVENPPPAWWDRTGRYYTPPGVEIVLHGEVQCPYVQIIRHTARYHPTLEGEGQVPYYWKSAVGEYVELGAPQAPYAPQPGECMRPEGTVKIGVHDDVATFPFPPDGVIYAEGNVRIRGVMPQNGNKQSLNPTDAPAAYFDPYLSTTETPARDRCYDLQVVSGGTIYIEGDLLSATAARTYESTMPSQVTSDTDIAIYDRDRAGRLALIARDDVCVNTTAFQPRPANLEILDDNSNILNDSQTVYPKPDPATDPHPEYMYFQGVEKDANDLTLGGELKPPLPTEPASAEFAYRNVRLQLARLSGQLPALRLLMGHSGWYVTKANAELGQPGERPEGTDPIRQTQVLVRRFLNEAAWPWSQEQEWYTFRGPGLATPTEDASDHWYLEPDRANLFEAGNDYLEFLPNGTQTMLLGQLTDTPEQRFTFEPQVVPVRHQVAPGPPPTYEWDVDPHQLGYVLGPVAVAPLRDDAKGPLPVEIDALVYAQNGSWFILPGPWFNEDPDEVYESEPGGIYPAYHEPLNIAIRFYGAISENMPAPAGDVSDWTSKWAGPYGARGGFLTYTYDPVLRWYRGEARRPVFPNFLLTPDLIMWGERVAGAGGAGT
jgi:hypothetical protein